jgi:hypothetical protein
MKKLYTILAVLFLTASAFAQAPEKMSYQAVVRDSGDALVTSQLVGMQISILQTTATGTAVYVETQTPTTNVNGLVSLEIGTGIVVSGDFTTIDWSTDSYFIKTETDPAGGTTYTITGTSQLMSVPFALYAKTSGDGAGPIGPQGLAGNDGATGPTGQQGLVGNDGVTGPQGLAGNGGATGTTGQQGLAGNDGATGADGPAGNDGTTGATGQQGLAGNDGVTGLTGPQGTIGLTGATGQQGLAGNDGATGTTGQQGLAGNDGATGQQGLAGNDGATGTTGQQGLAGNDGATGPQGLAGNDGATGLTGPQGAVGPTGPTGPAGSLGPQGIPGVDGVGIAQTLSFTSPNLVLSDNGGSIDLTGLINDADSDNSNEIQNLSQVLTEGNTAGFQLKNVTDPTDAQDATTKAYVDAQDATTIAYVDALIATLEARIVALEQSQPRPATVGDFRAGGVVFWVDPADNTHGLVCALSDDATFVAWGCSNTDLPNVPNVPFNGGNPVGLGAEIGDGESNTNSILNDCPSAPAALAARSIGLEWFLPSVKELNQMYIHKTTLEAVSGFSAFSSFYWSSTEGDGDTAWRQYFFGGNQFNINKFSPDFSVRAVRAF